MQFLKPLDAAWLYVQSRETPMHVAGLQIFEPPAGARPDFLQDMVAHMKAVPELASPWNLRLVNNALRGVLPAWETDTDVDLDYHVRHSALAQPGGERELGVLVSRLHSHRMDLRRPLWECHVIEGLEGGRFALYTKMHHSLVDGVGGMRMIQRAMAAEPGDPIEFDPPWSAAHAPQRRAGPRESQFIALRRQLAALPETRRALIQAWRGKHRGDALEAPFSAPKSVLNGRVTAQRRFATQQYDMARLHDLAKRADATLNDIVLAICSGALRRFLLDRDDLPATSLTAGLPVSIRPQGDMAVGTAISFILANLGTDHAYALDRLGAIRESTRRAKTHLAHLPRAGMSTYTMLFMGPFMGAQLLGLGGVGHPMFNLAISNVPGPQETLHLGGARLVAMYPVSVLLHGQALNITCVSYAGKLNFGFTGCRKTLAHMQRLAVYTGEALEELEQVLR